MRACTLWEHPKTSFATLLTVVGCLIGCQSSTTAGPINLCFEGCLPEPTVRNYSLIPVPPSTTYATLSVETDSYGRVFISGTAYRVDLGGSYVLHVHGSACGILAVTYTLGPATAKSGASATTVDFPAIGVSSAFLDSNYSADVHAGDSPTILACGVLR